MLKESTKVYCDECWGLQDTSTMKAEDVLSSIKEVPDGWNVTYVSGRLICDYCLSRLCMHQHPLDNHFCMRYSGHEGDHECCKRHMFY